MSDSKFILAGVMGWPVAHSRSPVIHNHWIEQHGLNGRYVLLPVQPERFEDAMRGLVALGFAGCNVTIPHKISAMKAMDWVDPLAVRMGAVNTVVVQADGALHGFNTDGFGYIESLRDAQPQWRGNLGPALVLGAGGASRAIVVSLLDEGAPEVRLVNRTRAKAQELADEIDPLRVKVYDWQERNAAMAGVSLLINTTSQGMHGEPELDVVLDDLPAQALVSDVIYVPAETPLLATARQRGHVTVNGLGMLLHQARPGFEAWFDVKPEITPQLRQAVEATL